MVGAVRDFKQRPPECVGIYIAACAPEIVEAQISLRHCRRAGSLRTMDDSNRSLATGLLRLDWNRFAVPVNGFLMPLITVVTLVNNGLVLAVLLRQQMRSPTNALLAALAVSDTLMILCPLPCFVHFSVLFHG